MKPTRHTRISGNRNWIALDSGGTMTDAVVLDTSDLTPAEAIAAAISAIEKALAS